MAIEQFSILKMKSKSWMNGKKMPFMSLVVATNQWEAKKKPLRNLKLFILQIYHSAMLPKKSTPSTNKKHHLQNEWRRGGIRTPGTFRHTRFRVGHIRPLCHLSQRLILAKPYFSCNIFKTFIKEKCLISTLAWNWIVILNNQHA